MGNIRNHSGFQTFVNDRSVALSPAHQKQGPFPPPTLLGLNGCMALSAFRAGHHPIDDVEGATFTKPGYPAITQITFLACCAHYPGGSNRCLSISSLSVLPSPVNRRVGIHDFTFGACSSFTHVAACQIACPPIADVCPEAPTQSVTRPSRSVATMLIDIYMDGFSLHWRSAPLRRTVNYRVALFVRVPGRNGLASRQLTGQTNETWTAFI